MVTFVAIGLVVLAALIYATTKLGMAAAREEALDDARSYTDVLAHSVAEPAIPRGLVGGEAGPLDRFDRTMQSRLLVGEVRRIKIWDGSGRIVYSDETRLIGDQFDLGEEEIETLQGAGIEAELSDLAKPENRYEPVDQPLVEVYTAIDSPEGEPLLFEAYYSADVIERRQREVLIPFRKITIGALVVLVLIASGMLWVLARRVTRAAAERERLLRRAAEASDAERRRIARDLHDGVVQDLAGSAFTLSALAGQASPTQRAVLQGVGVSLRRSQRALRSLLVEIHPPDLSAKTLRAALEDLTAPAAEAGTAATVSVTGLEEGGGERPASDASVALVWRVAQEAVRNAIRHARAEQLDVTVVRSQGHIELEVADDGDGFAPDEARARTRFGLRGLESLARDAGGTLQVDSAPGQGTRVRLEVVG